MLDVIVKQIDSMIIMDSNLHTGTLSGKLQMIQQFRACSNVDKIHMNMHSLYHKC